MIDKQVETKYPIHWTIPRVENEPYDEKFYKQLNDCDNDCHHPIHAFHPERRKHLIEKDLVEVATKNNWWDDVV